ncbi:MAG: S-layer homology domain-containing protein [Actinobacteria bacterium]|nr:S-layer homology domain-containing protein [Actinomycetota bacterium]
MSRLSLRRLVSVTAAAALAFSLLPASAAFAQERNIEEFACPPGDVTDPGFGDDDGNFAEAAIHCIVWYDLADGTSDVTFSPKSLVGRGAMAKFIANLLEVGGVALPTEPQDHFTDDEDSPFEPFINQLAELGVVKGTTETTYSPGQAVNRGQMASFLARAYQEITGTALPAGNDAFTDDDGTTHEDNIDRVAAAGIAAGKTTTTFAPGESVSRDQMALFLARELDLLVEEGFVTVPRGTADNETALDVPELLRVERANDTTVRFVFDESLNNTVNDAAFALYSFDATRTPASSTSRFEGDTVVATFPEGAVEDAVIGAVAAGAVQDGDANTSPEGHAALQNVVLAAGTTAAPDLQAVTVSGNDATFTFDEPAFNLEPAGYHLVLADGTDEVGAFQGGDGTATHTVTFDLPEGASVAYGYVDDGTVSDTEDDGNPTNGAEGVLNVLQEAHVSATGQTNRPDLASITIVSPTQVDYVFDENVTLVSGNQLQPAGTFEVYFTDATTEAAASREKTANNTIRATFAEGVLNDFVAGGIVNASAVTGANGANQPQELGRPLTFEAGDTAAPDLVSATITEDGDARVVRYTFDDDVATVTDGTAFKVYAADGSSDAFLAAAQFPPSDGSCTVDTQQPTVVECRVTAADDEDLHTFLATAVVAAVERDAVEGEDGHRNAEGAAVLDGAV